MAIRRVSFIAAASNSGKTTLIEKVVRVLKGRGLRIAVIKHASRGFDLDTPGKDSWRFQEAGADAVILSGPGRMALMRTIDRELSDIELAGMVGEVDLIIYEGFKGRAINTIEVFRYGISGDMPLALRDTSILALVSDRLFPVQVPMFGLDDANRVADFVCGLPVI